MFCTGKRYWKDLNVSERAINRKTVRIVLNEGCFLNYKLIVAYTAAQ